MQFTQWTNLFKRNNIDLKWPEDRAILLICFGIALLFWIFIKLSQEYTARKSVTFQFNIPEGQTFVNLPPNDMVVELEGTGWDLMSDFFANSKIDLEYQIADTEEIVLTPNRLESDILNRLKSTSLRIRSNNYDGLRIQLEPKKVKKVPVRLMADINFAPGFQLQKAVALLPDSIEVSGPVSFIDAIQYWETDSASFLDLDEPLKEIIALKKSDPSIQISPLEIEVNILAEQFTQNSIFIPIEIRNPPDSNMRIFPNNISVNYIVGLSQYSKIQAKDFSFIVDFKETNLSTEGNNSVPIQLIKRPDSIRGISYSPKVASYFFVKDSTALEPQ